MKLSESQRLAIEFLNRTQWVSWQKEWMTVKEFRSKDGRKITLHCKGQWERINKQYYLTKRVNRRTFDGLVKRGLVAVKKQWNYLEYTLTEKGVRQYISAEVTAEMLREE